MPIKPNALPSPEPDDRTPEEIAGKVEHDDLAENDRDPQTPGTGEEIAQEEQPKRARRTKAQMIEDAVVPADDAPVEIKDSITGAKITRPWTDAVALVKAGTAQWVDKAMKYALLKAEQASGGPASQEPMGAADTGEPSAQTPSPATHDASGQRLAPEGAALGDEVVIGSETYIVGHGGVLVQGVVAVDGEIVKPKRRWQRELGAGSGRPLGVARPDVRDRTGRSAPRGPGQADRLRDERRRRHHARAEWRGLHAGRVARVSPRHLREGRPR
jgi:hypothetical protein